MPSSSKTSLLASLDKFGIIPSINWKGDAKTHSYCGMLMTIVIFSLVIVFAVLFSTNMIYKRNPIQTQSILYGGLGKEHRLINDDIFKIGFGLMDGDSYKYFTDPTIYTVSASLNIGNNVGPDTVIPLDLEICSTDKDSDFYQATCFSKKQTHTSQIHLSKANVASIEVLFTRCQPGPGVTCALSSDIDAKLAASVWTTSYTVWSVDPTNFEHPVTMDLTDESYEVPAISTAKNLKIDLLAMEFDSDSGWITSSNNVEKMVTYESSQMDFLSSGYGDTFFILDLRMSGNKMSYKRQYDKIQNVLAQISGTMSLITIVIGLLAIPYAQNNMYELLVNEAYSITGKDNVQRSLKRRSGSRGAKRNQPRDRVTNTANNSSSGIKSGDTLNKSSSFKINSSTKRNDNIELTSPGQSQKTTNIQAVDNSHNSRDLVDVETTRIQIKANEPVDKASPEKVNEDYLDHSQTRLAKNQDESNKLISNNLRTNGALDASNIYRDVNRTNGDKASKSTKAKGSELEDSCFKTIELQSPNKDIEQSKLNINAPTKSLGMSAAKQKNLNTTFKQWFISLFKHSSQSKALAKGKSEILKHVDIFSIIRRFQEIDNLKACLLTKHQRILFDNIAKPSLIINTDLNPKDKDFITVYGWDESYRDDKVKLYEAYRSARDSEGMTDLDRQILELYESSLNDHEYNELEALF